MCAAIVAPVSHQHAVKRGLRSRDVAPGSVQFRNACTGDEEPKSKYELCYDCLDDAIVVGVVVLVAVVAACEWNSYGIVMAACASWWQSGFSCGNGELKLFCNITIC